MTIGDGRYTKRHEAGQRLKALLGRQMAAVNGEGWRGPIVERHGQLAGFEVTGTARRVLQTAEVMLALDGVPESETRLSDCELEDIDPGRLIVRLENRLHSLESMQAKTSNEIGRIKVEAARATEDLGKPFPLSEQLAEARGRLAQIDQQLEEAARRLQRGDDEVPPKAVQDRCDASDRVHANRNVATGVRIGAQDAVAVASRGFPPGQAAAAGTSAPAALARLPATRRRARPSMTGFNGVSQSLERDADDGERFAPLLRVCLTGRVMGVSIRPCG